MFRFAFSTRIFRQKSIYQAIDAVAFAGYDGLELWCDEPHAYPPRMTYREVARIRRRLETVGIEVSHLEASSLSGKGAFGSGWSPSWVEPERIAREFRLQHTLACIRLAGMLEVPYVVVGPGGAIGPLPYREGLERFAEGLLVALRHAEESGVTLLVEPAPGALIEDLSDWERLACMLPSSSLGVSLDVGALFSIGEDPADAIRALEESLHHVRLSDIAASRAPQPLLPGDGCIDFLAVLEALEEIAFTGFLTLCAPEHLLPEEVAVRALDRLSQLWFAPI